MRILQVLEPGRDGVFRHVENLIQFLIKSGVHVDLVFSSRRSCDQLFELVKRVSDAGGECVDIKVGPLPSMGDFYAVNCIRNLIKKNSYDVVHAHSSKAGALVRCLDLVTSVPTIVYTPHAYYGMGGTGYLASIFNAIERSLARRGITINVSLDEEKWAKQFLGIDSQSTIPNGVNLLEFKPPTESERRSARAKFGIAFDDVVFGSVGRMAYQKNPTMLVRAFGILAKKSTSYKMLYVGSGVETDQVLRILRDYHIDKSFIHVTHLSEMPSFYAAIDVFTLASRYEGLPYAVLEALSTNLPCALTEVLGNRGFKQYGFSAIYYAKSDDPRSMADAMLMAHRSIESNRHRNHRALVSNHFNFDHCCRDVLNLYKSNCPRGVLK